MNKHQQELPEGILRTVTTLDGLRLTLEYTAEHGYQIGTRFTWLARRLSTLELASAMIETLALTDKEELHRAIKCVRIEYARLRGWQFRDSAQKEWAIINGALNRLEGKSLKLSGRHLAIQEWI